MSDEVRCPYCHSRDLSIIPPTNPEAASNTISYKCQMCGRTFSKTAAEKNQDN